MAELELTPTEEEKNASNQSGGSIEETVIHLDLSSTNETGPPVEVYMWSQSEEERQEAERQLITNPIPLSPTPKNHSYVRTGC